MSPDDGLLELNASSLDAVLSSEDDAPSGEAEPRVVSSEAGTQDGWQVDSNLRDGVVFNAPTTVEERADLAQTCVLRLNMAMPMLLDDMSDTVDGLYNGLPERLYVLDAEHKVYWKTVAGSPGFDPEAWRAAIDRFLRQA